MFKKNISIVTNYEPCPHRCWFCIWRGHSLEHVRGPSIESIERFLFKYKNQGYSKFSISGTDAIFEYPDRYEQWFEFIHSMCSILGLKYDIHTRSRPDIEILKNRNLRKLVLSTENLKDCSEYVTDILQRFSTLQVRLVKVITQNTMDKDIEDYINFAKKHNVQMTFKQLVGHDDKGKYDMFKEKYSKISDLVVFLDKGDYNIYLMPDGKEYSIFFNIKSNERSNVCLPKLRRKSRNTTKETTFLL